MSYDLSAPVIYDLIYQAMKDYRKEADQVMALARQYGQSDGRDLLDVGCGTGLHDQYFATTFNVTGVDLSESMLATARRRNPGIAYHRGDMNNFDLGQKFDVVTNLFSAIGHTDRLDLAIATMVNHLWPGGVLIVEGSFNPDSWQEGHIGRNFADSDDLKITRISVTSRQGNQASLDMHYVVAQPGSIEYFNEHHDIWMYTQTDFEQAFRSAGLSSAFHPEGINPNGRGVYIGIKPL